MVVDEILCPHCGMTAAAIVDAVSTSADLLCQRLEAQCANCGRVFSLPQSVPGWRLEG